MFCQLLFYILRKIFNLFTKGEDLLKNFQIKAIFLRFVIEYLKGFPNKKMYY